MHESTAPKNISDQGRNFAVAALGFEEKERNLLRNILRISEQHPLEFRPFQPERDGLPTVVIVNADNAESLRRWAQLEQSRRSSKTPMTAIYLARSAPPTGAHYYLNRPFLATRLFSLLERVVTERHGYVPDLGLASDDMLMLTSEEDSAQKAAIQASPVANKIATAKITTGRSALIVDDSLPVRIQMKAPLESMFDHVDVAETGEEALALLDTRSYDLVLLDVILPGIDGYEVCKRIKKHPNHADTTVVMLTSNSSPTDKVKGKMAGCETYLIKPLKASVFQNVLRGLVPARAAA